MNVFSLLLSAVSILGPSGEKVCDVTLPALPQGACIETTNLENAVAWRIHFEGEGERRITDEGWVFDFGADLRCWPVSHAQGEYVQKTLSTISQMAPRPDFAPVAAGIGEMHNYATHFPGTAESPLVVEGPGFVAAIGDAGCLDYARIRFASGEKPGTVKTVLEGETFVKAPYVTPWRYIHVAKDAAALANAQPALMDALNAPSRIADTSWIKPGKVLRVAKLDTDCGKAAVDFVKRNNMQYIELDCGWYGQEHTGDPLKPGLAPERVAKGEKFDLFEILRYAKEKDVGVILYVNREPLKKNRDAILDQLVKWGVKGVKYGFVNVGNQEWRRWVTDAIAAAADRELLVDIHDEYRLTGIQKTYPNVMTVEGICGNEEMPNAAHDCALPFTRFLDGPGDYTPCWNNGRVKNTLAHQLALPCVYTSGWQFLFWYSRPDQIPEKDPALDFWRELPASFDETRFLQGEIGKFAVVARRKGRTWYVAGINGLERRAFTMDTSFLGAGEWKCRLFRDADPAIESGLGRVTVESMPVAPTMTIPAAARGGFAAIFEQKAVTDCYWHWMNGNVSKEGITADLEYMKAGGIEAAMIFDVGIGAKRGKVDYASAEWKDCVAWASKEAERLGMELSLHNSPGYSACGGPWIAPEESMKELVWRVEKFKVQSSKCRGANAKLGYYREIARYPLATADETIDIDKRLEKGESVEFALDCEKEVSALNVWRGKREKPLDPFDGPRDYGCTLKVEAFDGAAWHAVGDVICPTLRARDVPGFLRLKSPARATRLRLTSNRGANLARIEVISATPAEGRELVIGYTTTGQMVTAAPDSGIGLECDKFSRRGVDAHFDRHLDPLFANCGKGAFRYLVIDSWEAGKQDWTDDFAAKFKARCGYDCLPWLPALTGRNVLHGRIHPSALDKEQSQGQLKFTFDYEATKKHLFETEFLAPFAERAHKLGLLVAGEPYGDGDFDMETFVKYLDLPMSEYWAKSHYGSIERPMRVNAAAKSCGKTYVGCEAFTAFPGDADIAPTLENFAEAIDLLKSAGVKRFVFHSVVHQPSDDSALTMGPFGTRFDRAHCTPSALRRITDYIKQR